MNSYDLHRVERLRRRLEELRTWRNAGIAPVEEWEFAAADGTTAALRRGDRWPTASGPVTLAAEAVVPAEWAGLPLELELWLGGEGYVELSTGLRAGLNPFHRSFPVELGADCRCVAIRAEVMPKGMFGSHVHEPRLDHAALVVPHPEVRALDRDLSMIAEACAVLDEHEVVPHLLNVAERALRALQSAWPSDSATTVTRYLEGFTNPLGEMMWQLPPADALEAADIAPAGRELWHREPAPQPLSPLSPDAVDAVRDARSAVAAGLGRLREEYPPVGRLALSGHAHLDLAWLWPVVETRRKGRRTFSSVLSLMDRYDDFTFNQSSAQLYAWIEQDDPELFERVRERVREGRWESVGGAWVESDCQVLGGESFVRQLLYGQRYFQEKFGARSTVAWLPDVFGFSPGIPQLLRGAGLNDFFTVKLTWNETDLFPYDLFEWEGIDGSSVRAHLFYNPSRGYNGNIAPADVLGTWRHFKAKRFHNESLLTFGWGDGGGGPSERMLENYSRLQSFPALPRLRMSRIDEFFSSLPASGLPRWVGELYLEYHRGTLTTQALVKALNRQAEHRLLEAEAFAALAADAGRAYPAGRLESAWKRLLLHHFHDILPGSSIAEVYKDTHAGLAAVVAQAVDVRQEALEELTVPAPQGESIVVANASLAPRPLLLELTETAGDGRVHDASGRVLPTQRTDGGLFVAAGDVPVPPLGMVELTLAAPGEPVQGPVRVERMGADVGIENGLLRAVVAGDGTVLSLRDLEADRETLDGPANALWAFVDKPREYDAWELEQTYEQEGEQLREVRGISVLEDGPLRARIQVDRAWRGSSITQEYVLAAGSRRLDIRTHIDWHERNVVLRAYFPVAVRARDAAFETLYGTEYRPTHRNTSWDAARFEVSGHRFADLSEPGYGVALLNDSKYGHGVLGNVLSLTLLRSPTYPDLWADEGEHRFTYALYPHAGTLAESDVVEQAFWLNSPLIALSGRRVAAGAEPFVRVEGLQLALGSLKRAEDDESLVLRVYEPRGARGESVLVFRRPVLRAEITNLLEEPDGSGQPIQVEDGAVRVRLRPFQVVTLKLQLGEAG